VDASWNGGYPMQAHHRGTRPEDVVRGRGRSPGLRVAAAVWPSRRLCASDHDRHQLAAYSCGGSSGIVQRRTGFPLCSNARIKSVREPRRGGLWERFCWSQHDSTGLNSPWRSRARGILFPAFWLRLSSGASARPAHTLLQGRHYAYGLIMLLKQVGERLVCQLLEALALLVHDCLDSLPSKVIKLDALSGHSSL
jgi:hypothetical protein